MKAIKILIVVFVLSCISAGDAFCGPKGQKSWGNQHRIEKPNRGGGKPVVGAPLDGGILIALGAAGTAFYSYRKRNAKNKES
jgi:hypothetical protein